MSKFANSPALQRFLRALGTGEKLSGGELRSRAGSEMKPAQREKLLDAGLLVVDRTGRGYVYRLTDDGMSFVVEELDGPLEATPVHDADRLSDKERIALFALLSPSLQLSTAEIKRTLGITIGPAVRASLKDRELVVVLDRPIRLELTEKGWQVAASELERPAAPNDPPTLKLLHHQSRQWLSTLRERGVGLIDLYTQAPAPETTPTAEPPKTVGARVIEAYEDLVGTPGGWVGLARLREHLADVKRDELDEVLTALFRDGRIKLITEVNQKTLTQADRDAALHVVGDDKHLYAVG